MQPVQVRRVRGPQMGGFHFHPSGCLSSLSIIYGQLFFHTENLPVITVIQFTYNFSPERLSGNIADMRIYTDFRRHVRNLVIGDKQPASRRFILVIGIGDEHIVMHYHPAIPVDTAEIGKIQHVLRFSGRIRGIVTIVRPYSYDIVLPIFQIRSDIDNDRQEAPVMLFQ